MELIGGDAILIADRVLTANCRFRIQAALSRAGDSCSVLIPELGFIADRGAVDSIVQGVVGFFFFEFPNQEGLGLHSGWEIILITDRVLFTKRGVKINRSRIGHFTGFNPIDSIHIVLIVKLCLVADRGAVRLEV